MSSARRNAAESAWDTLALPLRTKLKLAAELTDRGKVLWLAIDGAYAKRPFGEPVLALGVIVFRRLGEDARLLPTPGE